MTCDLDRVDALLPNGYARAEKLRWLAQAEGFVLREIRGAEGALPEMTEETELTLNANSSVATRDGAMTMVILGLQFQEDT